jgi:hypothetical protein
MRLSTTEAHTLYVLIKTVKDLINENDFSTLNRINERYIELIPMWESLLNKYNSRIMDYLNIIGHQFIEDFEDGYRIYHDRVILVDDNYMRDISEFVDDFKQYSLLILEGFKGLKNKLDQFIDQLKEINKSMKEIGVQVDFEISSIIEGNLFSSGQNGWYDLYKMATFIFSEIEKVEKITEEWKWSYIQNNK